MPLLVLAEWDAQTGKGRSVLRFCRRTWIGNRSAGFWKGAGRTNGLVGTVCLKAIIGFERILVGDLTVFSAKGTRWGLRRYGFTGASLLRLASIFNIETWFFRSVISALIRFIISQSSWESFGHLFGLVERESG